MAKVIIYLNIEAIINFPHKIITQGLLILIFVLKKKKKNYKKNLKYSP